jgi:hypothetical protein
MTTQQRNKSKLPKERRNASKKRRVFLSTIIVSIEDIPRMTFGGYILKSTKEGRERNSNA